MIEHAFETAVKGLTGLPPFHNIPGEYWDSMSAADTLVALASTHLPIEDRHDIFEVVEWLNNHCRGYFCYVGHSVYFDDDRDAFHFKLVWA